MRQRYDMHTCVQNVALDATLFAFYQGKVFLRLLKYNDIMLNDRAVDPGFPLLNYRGQPYRAQMIGDYGDELHFWWNGYVNKQNCRIWSEANPQVYVETSLHPETLTVWCALWAGGIIGPYFFKNDEGHNVTNWPPRSCDLSPLDYFLWGYAKSLVYADKPQMLDHLENNIRRVIADIRPQMLEKVVENWTSRLDYIGASRGSPMPEIIFKL
ncbi:uncharacterized protein TNCV_4463821 [Trichonephila clavipes]|nr:uncharacterized protein TNCV_4463821 [Trichonephila clavipes]